MNVRAIIDTVRHLAVSVGSALAVLDVAGVWSGAGLDEPRIHGISVLVIAMCHAVLAGIDAGNADG